MKKTFNSILYHLSRIALGVVFAISGGVKAIDPLGTVYKIEDYLKAFGGGWTELIPLAWVAALGLIGTEIVLAILLLFPLRAHKGESALLRNVRVGIAPVVTLLFYMVMTPLTYWIAQTNPVTDCGCFGDAIVLTNTQTYHKNLILLALSVVLTITAFVPKATCGKEHPATRWVVRGGRIVMAAVFGFVMIYAYYYLPLIDFRPYKVGADLVKLMEVPEDAPEDVYETTLIYADDEGNEREFTLSNYPKGDPNWTFVDQRSVLVQKGYESPIHDFIILNSDGDDITYDLLEDEEPVTLCILYDLKRSDSGASEAVKRLAEKTDNLYILTGAGEADIRAFGMPENAEVCFCDPVTLKTIVRANPGVVVLKHGVIQEKYHLR